MTRQIVFALLLLVGKTSAQSYKTAVGLRLGPGIGFSYNQHIKDRFTVEVMAWPGLGAKNPAGFSALFKDHHKFITRRTNWYWGAGPHLYLYDIDPGFSVGPSGMLGVETTIGKLNFSIDSKLDWQIAGPNPGEFDATIAAFSIRYVLKKRERPKLFDKVKIPRIGKKKDSKGDKRKKRS